jgi:hypothetical protein
LAKEAAFFTPTGEEKEKSTLFILLPLGGNKSIQWLYLLELFRSKGKVWNVNILGKGVAGQ